MSHPIPLSSVALNFETFLTLGLLWIKYFHRNFAWIFEWALTLFFFLYFFLSKIPSMQKKLTCLLVRFSGWPCSPHSWSLWWLLELTCPGVAAEAMVSEDGGLAWPSRQILNELGSMIVTSPSLRTISRNEKYYKILLLK
jgi:hypothetical protein